MVGRGAAQDYCERLAKNLKVLALEARRDLEHATCAQRHVPLVQIEVQPVSDPLPLTPFPFEPVPPSLPYPYPARPCRLPSRAPPG